MGEVRIIKINCNELSPNGSWKEEPAASIGEGGIGVGLDKDLQTQRIGELNINWSSIGDADGVGVAIPSLIRVITDNSSTTRQKLKSADTILNYRVEDASVVEFTKKFLQSICTGEGIATDYRVEAAGLLRRCESPKVQPATIKSTYTEPAPEKPVIPLKELVKQRHERQVRMEQERIERERAAIERELGLPPGGAADIADPCDFLLKLHTSYFQKS